jgi:phosphoribosyl 1,2-cyclic phosphodiesterase
MESWRLKVGFWGVRGSLPTPSSNTLNIGGNTSCVEIRGPGGEIAIFDSGTGIRELGDRLVKESQGRPLSIHLFLSHFHWDHIQGLPFFAPLYNPANSITIYSSHCSAPLKAALTGLMSPPYFPVKFESLPACIELVELGPDVRQVGLLAVSSFPVNHPQGACGYRVECAGAVVVYVPDREHGMPEMDRMIREQARSADLLIHDSQYTPEEYEQRKGWGHSTWLETVRLAQDADVKRLVLYHHDPSRTDGMLDQITEKARVEFPNTWAAKEGWTIEI